MKNWERTRCQRLCGLCNHLIAVGEPVLFRWIAGHSWRKVRCVSCANEPVPELPPVSVSPRAVPMTPIARMERISQFTLDWKQRAAAGVREPGDEG
jgi:hypothetical protein